MKPLVITISAAMVLSACAVQRDLAYCNKMGTPQGHAEFEKCIAYFHKQENWFSADLAICEEQADITYPRSLYDYGGRRHGRVYGGFGIGGGHRYGGGFGGVGSRHVYVEMEPDYAKNAQVDALRQRIILPCMQQKGWNSARDWELGRNRK